VHEMILNKKEELAIGNCQFFCSKIGKKDKNERDKEKKKLKDEGKKESEEESNNLEKYTSTMKV